jgi:hypothetical protein
MIDINFGVGKIQKFCATSFAKRKGAHKVTHFIQK